jgi:nucleotide-binding universal stress UspA family protein
MTTPPRAASASDATDVFRHVLVELDETPESLIAASQAKCLAHPDGELELLAVVERASAAQAGAAATFAADSSEAATAAALEHARSLLEPTTARFVAGRARDAVLNEADRIGATLVAIGMHPHGRRTARLFGTLDAAMLRDAPCSVLISRPGWGPAKPRRIVVGTDGSDVASFAEDLARALGERLDVPVEVVIALGGKSVDDSVYRPENADARLDPREPPDALAHAASECDLLVIGDRGARGARGLGHVGARIVYAVRSSVLVVRIPATE